jgi:hypothetical protein
MACKGSGVRIPVPPPSGIDPIEWTTWPLGVSFGSQFAVTRIGFGRNTFPEGLSALHRSINASSPQTILLPK